MFNDFNFFTIGEEFLNKTQGSVYSTGRNNAGQLGLGDNTDRDEFTQIGGASDWKAFGCGSETLGIVNTSRKLYTSGSNSDGQLGINNTTDQNSLTLVSSNYDDFKGGSQFTIARNSQTLYASGTDNNNAYGVSYGPSTTYITFAANTVLNYDCGIGSEQRVMFVKTNGTLWAVGANAYSQSGITGDSNLESITQIGTDTDWVNISCGFDHSIALKSDGTLWGAGADTFGQISGAGTIFTQIGTDTDWIKVVCLRSASLALKNDGTLWATGLSGRVGLGSSPSAHSTFTQIGTDTDWAEIGCGEYHSYAIKRNGTLWATGSNFYGQLGLNDTTNRDTFTQVGTDTDWTFATGGTYFGVAMKGITIQV